MQKRMLKQGQTVNGSKAIDKETRHIDIVRQKFNIQIIIEYND